MKPQGSIRVAGSTPMMLVRTSATFVKWNKLVRIQSSAPCARSTADVHHPPRPRSVVGCMTDCRSVGTSSILVEAAMPDKQTWNCTGLLLRKRAVRIRDRAPCRRTQMVSGLTFIKCNEFNSRRRNRAPIAQRQSAASTWRRSKVRSPVGAPCV